jgi:hypothetical protein
MGYFTTYADRFVLRRRRCALFVNNDLYWIKGIWLPNHKLVLSEIPGIMTPIPLHIDFPLQFSDTLILTRPARKSIPCFICLCSGALVIGYQTPSIPLLIMVLLDILPHSTLCKCTDDTLIFYVTLIMDYFPISEV